MAGIGFELKKIFKERSVVNLIKGSFYSTFAVIGPMLILILGFLALNVLLDYTNVAYDEKDLLTSIILYVFVFSLIFTSPLSAVVSRYIADTIFEERFEDVIPCYYTGLLINVLVGLVFALPFCAVAVFKGQVSVTLMFAAGCMFFSLLIVFYTLTFISALKEYKSISYTFVIGVLIAVALAYVLFNAFGVGYTMAVVVSTAVGFTFMAFILFTMVRKFFPKGNGSFKGLFVYLKRYKLLLFTNLAYILGLYIHNFVCWWFSEYAIVVADTFRSAPVYDTATFLAMMTSVSATVIFTVRVEINFHDRYQVYCEELLGGIGADIAIAKDKMFSTLIKEVFYIVQIQLIITVAIFLFLMIFASTLGFGGPLLSIYPALAAGYLVVYLMYCMIIFVYYFDDGKGAFAASLAFFVVTAGVSIFAMSLDHTMYGIGPFFGAFAGWTVAFFRLRFIERNLNAQMFCRGSVLRKTVRKGGHNAG